MAKLQKPPNRQRGTSLIEVLVATVVLTLAFLFVSGDMIASTQAEKTAAQRGISISMANYFIDQMRQDSSFWSATSPGPGGEWDGTNWTGAPPGSDPCGGAWPAYNDSLASATWHNVPVCAGSPFANETKVRISTCGKRRNKPTSTLPTSRSGFLLTMSPATAPSKSTK